VLNNYDGFQRTNKSLGLVGENLIAITGVKVTYEPTTTN
jgi:hypothetical protein